MRLIESSVEIIPQESGLEGIYKAIEIAARTCYKSESFIKEGSAEKMVNALIQRGHGSPLEAGTIYLKIPVNKNWKFIDDNFTWTKSNLVQEESGNWWAVTTNYRRIVECGWKDILQYICEPTEHHEKRYMVRFICSRSIANEFVRHRVFSFCQTSQRYVNYSLGKFGSEIEFVIPEWVKAITTDTADTIDSLTGERKDYLMDMPMIDAVSKYMPCESRAISCWYDSMKKAEDDYMYLIREEELKPEEARSVLTNDCKTELVMTGFISDWNNFFSLRIASTAHPDAKHLACLLRAEFMLRGYI